MTTVKITTVGNSLGIILPRDVLLRLRVDKGDVLHLVETRGGVELVPYEPEFAAQLEALEFTARAERDVLFGLQMRASSRRDVLVRDSARGAAPSPAARSRTSAAGDPPAGRAPLDENA